MRLIDADELVGIFEEAINPYNESTFNRFITIINATPTAYDVNKVLKELEDSLYDTNTYGACDDLETIVKRGGIDEG